MSENIQSCLFDEISTLPVIDTHEHLYWSEQYWLGLERDVLSEYLVQYLSSDLFSAGLKGAEFNKLFDTTLTITEKWKLIEPYWEVSRYTGYGRTLDIAVKAIYGIDGINSSTIEALNEKYLENKKPGHYKHVLKDMCGIETSLVDVPDFRLEGENGIFKRSWRNEHYIMGHNIGDTDIVEYSERHTGIKVKTLDDWLAVIETELDYFISTYNMRVIKNALAYQRSIRYEMTEYSLAKQQFTSALDKREAGKSLTFPHELQDYIMHFILKLADKRNLTYQIHTGILEGTGNTLANSDPTLLNNLFLEYPNVDFDLFHVGYPYQGTVCALAKMFPNVFIDMCWAHIVSPSACVSALGDFLDAVPYNKISAFGGDYCLVDGVYGHLYISRQNVSRALTDKVQSGVFDETKAVEIAKAIYYENPKRIFKL